ncbi:hypothetical protein TIFTF001_005441 [Ficus carica]|uniref:B box-type domain-containing protein n=1 Tax=Ficus carica TaxID=3494 RepID=A0AA87ZEY7_FICCA|nr:hypothetical protein TIFTF001_005441 [Ficus carica]
MKIQCDVCNKDEASVFCTADEAVLCAACDHRVHHANKLASKHQRFSLLLPSSKQIPLCDICQDRAILCRECDHPIHSANEHTQKHNRFLLTGVKLSATSTLYGSSSDSVPNLKTLDQPSVKKKSVSVTVAPTISNPPDSVSTKNSDSSPSTTTISKTGLENPFANDEVGFASSISDYLIETLPGWHVEDFLDSSSPAFGFCKGDDGISPFLDCELANNLDSFSVENMGIWVPQAPAPLYPSEMGKVIVGMKETKEATNFKANSTARRWSDDGFTVPQINFPSSGSKRSRPFW